MADRARIGAGDRVCDVGCGYGGPARYFAESRGARVSAVTLSGRQADHAHRRSGADGRVAYVVADFLDNPFPDRAFDVLVAIESASHMADKRRFVEECRRVLRPGGRLVVAAWLASEEPTAWARRRLLEPICSEGRLPSLASASEYRGWMEGAGLRVVSYEDLSERVRRTWTVCLRRLSWRLAVDAEARRYLLDGRRTERVFALTLARIWLAYRVGALRYGVFSATR